jgi:hypothetical protein
MRQKPIGTVLLAWALLAAGLAGIAALWVAWPPTTNTSPLAALFASLWSSAYLVSAVLTWRRSRFAGPAFVLAIGLLAFPASYAFPGSQLFLPLFLTLVLIGGFGYRFLRASRQSATS